MGLPLPRSAPGAGGQSTSKLADPCLGALRYYTLVRGGGGAPWSKPQGWQALVQRVRGRLGSPRVLRLLLNELPCLAFGCQRAPKLALLSGMRPRAVTTDALVYGMVWYGMVWYGMVWYGMAPVPGAAITGKVRNHHQYRRRARGNYDLGS
nr:unnamed protein product [Digitaria exilis]